jgi:DNA-binding NtrC family response regulator
MSAMASSNETRAHGTAGAERAADATRVEAPRVGGARKARLARPARPASAPPATAARAQRHSDVRAVVRPPKLAGVEGFPTLAEAVRDAERRHIEVALRIAGGRKGRAAALLGISRKNRWEKLRSFANAGGDATRGDEGEPRAAKG